MSTEQEIRELIEHDGNGNIRVKPGHEAEVANWLADQNINDDISRGEEDVTRVESALRRQLLEIEQTFGIHEVLNVMVNSLGWGLPGVKITDSKQMDRLRQEAKSNADIEYLREHGVPDDERMEEIGYTWDEENESWIRQDPNQPLIEGYRPESRSEPVKWNDPDALIEESNRIIAEEYGMDEDDMEIYLPTPDEVLNR